MPNNNNSLTTRKRRLPQRCYDDAATLRKAYNRPSGYTSSEYRVTTKRQREEILETVSRLGDSAKIDHSDLDVEATYIEALRALTVWNEQGKPDLAEVEKNADAARLAKLAQSISEKADALRRAEYAAKFEPPKAGATPRRSVLVRAPRRVSTGKKSGYTITLVNGAPNIGYIAGEWLDAKEAADSLKVGDPATAWDDEGDRATTGRVVAADARSFTIRYELKGGELAEKTFERATCAWAGRIVGTVPAVEDADAARLAALRKKLDRLGDEDDQIIRCSARYELEKKIYDITHPIVPPFDPEAWPEELRVIGE